MKPHQRVSFRQLGSILVFLLAVVQISLASVSSTPLRIAPLVVGYEDRTQDETSYSNNLEHPLTRKTTYVSVSDESEFLVSLSSGADISLNSDIALTSTVSILNLQNVRINGNGHKMSGNGTFRCFQVSGFDTSLLITNLTISHGYHETEGGGAVLITNGSRVHLQAVIVLKSSAAWGGGIALSEGASLDMADGKLFNNSAFEVGGGGLYVYRAILNLTTTTTSHNYAAEHYNMRGGGIMIIDSVANMTDCLTMFNNVSLQGGGVYAENSVMTISNSNFTRNKGENGGAVLVSGASAVVHITGSIFEHNKATFNYGGGIYVGNEALCFITACIVRHNRAAFEAGGVFVADFARTQITNSEVYGNYGNTNAGGVGLYANAFLNISHSVISNNTCPFDGGGILLRNKGVLRIDHSEISLNTASASGGGCSFLGSAIAYISSTKIFDNTAGDSYGGGIFIGGSDTIVSVEDSLIAHNTAKSSSGGAVFVLSGSVTIKKSNIRENIATGPLFNVTSGPCTAIGGCFYSPNYPLDYEINQNCQILVTANSTLNLVSFFTEPIYDYLTVNGVQYSSTKGPDGVAISKGDVIEFSSDYSVVTQGFEICQAKPFSGGGLHVIGGTVRLEGTIVAKNRAESYGGGIFIDGGDITLYDSSIADNVVAQAGSGVSFTSGSFYASNLKLSNQLSGVSASSLTCDSACLAGEYGNCTLATGTTDCYTDCTCLKCPSGKASASAASNSIDSCVSCGVGLYSDEGANICASCPSGTYASDNISDTSGGVSVQVSLGATTCNVCPAGKFSSTKGSIVCQACASGKSSFANSSTCTDCLPGKYSESDAPSCKDCEVGHAVSLSGSQRCVACSVGTFAANTSSLTCEACSPGKAQSATGQAHCDDCAAGTYAVLKGSSSCLECSGSYDSAPGSTNCSYCVENYFMVDDECVECVDGATCMGGSSNPYPDRGYWVDRNKFSYGDRVYECAWNTCIGFEKAREDNTDDDDPSFSSLNLCWSEEYFYNESCAASKLMCHEGSTGPLCGTCENGYTFNAASRTCLACDSAGVTMPSLAFALFCAAVLAILIAIRGYFYMGDQYEIKKHPFVQLAMNVDPGMLKLIYVTYQIIVSTSSTVIVKYPYPFDRMLNALGFFSLDFLAFDCLTSGPNPYFVTIYLWSIIPIIICVLIVLVGTIRYATENSEIEAIKRSNRTNIVNTHFWLFLFITYVVLPPVSNKQLQIFDCIELKGGESYIRSDTSIDCKSASYYQFRSIMLVFIVIYQLIPVYWFILLRRQKEALNPTTSAQDKEIALFIRDNNPDLTSLKFLFVDYRCTKWWFAVADMYRRIVFIGILPLISPRPSIRASFGCMLAMASVAYFREEQPYRVEFTNVIAHMAQFTILITFYSALSIATGVVVDFSLRGYQLGIFLILMNLCIILLAFWFAYSKYYHQNEDKFLKEFKANNTTDASTMGEEDFRLVFDTLWLQSVPSSHTLAFYYCSTEVAKLARKSGIPSEKEFNGVPLTLRHPHAVMPSDFAVFGDRDGKGAKQPSGRMTSFSDLVFPHEEVLVVSLPRQFLEPLTGYESDHGLFMVPAQVLTALRPTIFYEVVDKKPWNEGLILLQPGCILKSFILMDVNNTGGFAGAGSGTSSTNSAPIDKSKFLIDHEITTKISPLQIDSIATYLKAMTAIRQKCFKLHLTPLYHYTSSNVAPLILKNGLRMSSLDQAGDGGVYFSVHGPASHGIGSDRYELNIIKDCFGVERSEEFLGKGKVDLVVVYGCDLSTVSNAYGEVNSTKVVSKPNIKTFSLADQRGNYFLRPDRILGVFQVDLLRNPPFDASLLSELNVEKNRDTVDIAKYEENENKRMNNAFRIDNAVEDIWGSLIRGSTISMTHRSISQASSSFRFSNVSNAIATRLSSTSNAPKVDHTYTTSYTSSNRGTSFTSPMAHPAVANSFRGETSHNEGRVIEMGTIFGGSSDKHQNSTHGFDTVAREARQDQEVMTDNPISMEKRNSTGI